MISSAIAKNRKKKKRPVRKSLRKNQTKTSLTEAVRRLVSALSATSDKVGVFCFCGRIAIYKTSSIRFSSFVENRHEALVGIYDRCFLISDVIDDFGLFFTDETTR